MPQLHCYVSDTVAAQLQNKAEQAHLSVSKYLAELIRQDVSIELDEEFFALYGAWEGEPLSRGEQGGYEQRLELD